MPHNCGLDHVARAVRDETPFIRGVVPMRFCAGYCGARGLAVWYLGMIDTNDTPKSARCPPFFA